MNTKTQAETLAPYIAMKNGITLEQAEGAINKASMLINLAYILADVQEYLIKDATPLLNLYREGVTQQTKQRFGKIQMQLKSVNAQLHEEARKWNTTDEDDPNGSASTKSFIEGSSDFYYDAIRMLFDRMASKRDVIHFISILRKEFPNINHYFPQLDKGRYIVS